MTSPTRDEALEAEFVRRVSRLFLSDEEGVTDQNDATETLDNLIRLARFALLSPDAGGDQPRPSVSEDQGSSRDHALTDSVALDGEHFGPWRVWFDPPPIGTRECDWHYQHEDAEPECPAWMHGHCASRDACIAEIIDGYEERA